MDKQQDNSHVIHPKELMKTKTKGIQRFNNRLALKITNSVWLNVERLYIRTIIYLFSAGYYCPY